MKPKKRFRVGDKITLTALSIGIPKTGWEVIGFDNCITPENVHILFVVCRRKNRSGKLKGKYIHTMFNESDIAVPLPKAKVIKR